MSIQMNFVGRLTKDAVLKEVNGKSVLEFRIATDTGWGDKKQSEFMDAEGWGPRYKGIGALMGKGSLVAVTGTFTTREYKGEKKFKIELTDVVPCQLKPRDGAPEAPAADTGDLPF